ncbi:MAG: hypothetical protein IEMM0002_0088 [bacterium]|nr:MAG: hypothetical protein IEMM0002_0088 [bacterium]
MSNIIFNPDENSCKAFELKAFEDSKLAKKKKDLKEEFKPDHKGDRKHEFVPGGFDFEYEGGYRRDEIMKKTTDEIEEMLTDAKERVKDIEKEARESGYKAGHEKGSEDGVKKVESLLQTLKETIESLNETRNEFYAKSEKEMIDLVTLVSSEIIQREISSNKEVITGVMRKAVKEIHSKQSVKICVNPADLQSAKQLGGELIKETEAITNVSFEADEKITPGGCIVETNIGSLDATVENSLREILRDLKEQVV